MFKKLNPFKIFTKDDVLVDDVAPGTSGKIKPQQTVSNNIKKIKKETAAAVNVQEQTLKEYSRLMGRYVAPHNIKSKKVSSADIPRVIEDGKDMIILCSMPRGAYININALSHSQIENIKPLRFFILPNGFIVINPLIFNHTKVAVFVDEGCVSFPDKPTKTMVPRYHKIEVKYQSVVKDMKTEDLKLGPYVIENLSGTPSQIFQHEVSHLNGHNVYDEDYDPLDAIGLGDNTIILPELWD